MGDHKIKIGISLGDINGVGVELILKTFEDPQMFDMCIPIIYGSSKVLSYYKKSLDMESIVFQQIKNPDEAVTKKLNVINVWDEEIKIEPGTATTTSATYSVKALEHSMNDLSSKKIDALVTAPIDKSQLISAGFKFPGHTEYIASKSKGKPLMLMIHENIKVALVTGHIGVNEIAKQLNTELILEKLSTLHHSLRMDFSISKPKIAVLGLNPHAGDQGKFGKEEEEIIQPALSKAKQQNMLVFGPFPADGFFASGNFQKYDAILAMYHDQGLIPFKTISGMNGVNYTAGLDVIRTSPDHGPAFDIVGKNQASEASFRQAVYSAIDIFRERKKNAELLKNPLKKLSNEIIEGKEDESITDI